MRDELCTLVDRGRVGVGDAGGVDPPGMEAGRNRRLRLGAGGVDPPGMEAGRNRRFRLGPLGIQPRLIGPASTHPADAERQRGP